MSARAMHSERRRGAGKDGLHDGSIDRLVQEALADPDPVGWMRARVADAVDRLDHLHAPPPVKAEAKRQLLSIERRLIGAIRRAAAPVAPAVIAACTLLSGMN